MDILEHLIIMAYLTDSIGSVLVNDMQTPTTSKVAIFFLFVPKDAQCSETYAKTIFRFFSMFSINKIFILSFWDSRDFCKSNSETLFIPDNEFDRESQSKSLRGLGAEPPVRNMGSEAPHERGALGTSFVLVTLNNIYICIK